MSQKKWETIMNSYNRMANVIFEETSFIAYALSSSWERKAENTFYQCEYK